MAEKYNTIHINKIIYIGNYLNDGLTKTLMKVKLLSPIGMAERGLILCSKKCNFFTRLKGMIHYIAYSLYANNKFNFKNIKSRNC